MRMRADLGVSIGLTIALLVPASGAGQVQILSQERYVRVDLSEMTAGDSGPFVATVGAPPNTASMSSSGLLELPIHSEGTTKASGWCNHFPNDCNYATAEAVFSFSFYTRSLDACRIRVRARITVEDWGAASVMLRSAFEDLILTETTISCNHIRGCIKVADLDLTDVLCNDLGSYYELQIRVTASGFGGDPTKGQAGFQVDVEFLRTPVSHSSWTLVKELYR